MFVTITPILDKEVFPVSGKVELFPQKGGWYYVRVPQQYTEITRDVADRGLVAIELALGTSKWKSSLLPMGNGTHFVALPAKVRKKENIAVGDFVKLDFVLRNR